MKITKSATEITHSFGSSTTYNNSGGLLPSGTDTLQEAIDALAGSTAGLYLTVIRGGQGTTQNLSTLGATETIDLGNANYFYGTLDQNCTLSFTGWTTGKDSQITVEVTEDGTGGWTPTFSGVTWIGGIPTWTTTAATVTVAVFFSRDGGTTIYGAVVGSGGSALTIKDEGSSLATAATSLDFVGAGVTASGTGGAKTITIPSTGIQLASITAASSAIAATEAVVVSASLPAGTLVAGNSYRITGAGVGTTGVTPGTDTFRIRIGTTTLTGTIPTSTTALGVAAVTAQSFNFVAIITVRTSGASGTIIGECVAFSANVATGRYATLNNLSATTASVAIDTTVANLLELTFQSGNAGSSNTFHVASIEQLTVGAGITAPGAELDYVEFTSPVTVSGTSEGTADTVVTGSSVPYDGATVVMIEFSAPAVDPTTSAGAAIVILLYDGATVLGRLGVVINPAAAAMRVPVRLARRLTPSNASHSYIIKAYRTIGNGTIDVGTGGTGVELPGFIRITKV